jgi:hypothetical protein
VFTEGLRYDFNGKHRKPRDQRCRDPRTLIMTAKKWIGTLLFFGPFLLIGVLTHWNWEMFVVVTSAAAVALVILTGLAWMTE